MVDPDRAGAVAQLRAAYDDGKLDRQTYDARVASALGADSEQELQRLLTDIPGYAQRVPAFEQYPRSATSGSNTTFASDGISDPLPGQQSMYQAPWTDTRPYALATQNDAASPERSRRPNIQPAVVAMLAVGVAIFIFGSIFNGQFSWWIPMFIFFAIAGRSHRKRRD